MNYETVIFPLNNLDQLSADYVLYEIVGLTDSDEDFDSNIQYIVKNLSYKLKHPVTSIERDGKPLLVVRNDSEIIENLPADIMVKRGIMACFRRIGDPIILDFVNYDESSKSIILRFLQFDLQTELNKNPALWQPSSGDAFFNDEARETIGNVSVFNGFFVRVVELPDGGFGLAIDVTKKYISRDPLNVKLTRQQFKSEGVKSSHLVYQYGQHKYEIRADHFSDLNASEYRFNRPSDGKSVSLLQDTLERFGNPMPPFVANLPDDASAIIYKTNDNQERRVIAGLCYRVFDTEDPQIRKIHKKSIIIPFYRRMLIKAVRNRYLKSLRYGNVQLNISPTPVLVEKTKFPSPDLLFGKGTVLTTNNSDGAIRTSIDNLGRKRKNLLLDKNVGFYTTATFQTQYFVVPQTIFNMYGNRKFFLEHLISQVDIMHPTESGWNPNVITYDDRGKKNAIEIGFEILQKIKEGITKTGGYALVMLPSNVERVKRQHDDLAALVVSGCHEDHSITASIMHSDTLEECYIHKSVQGASTYEVRNDLKGKYSGYILGVAINQVLLNNERWPYILNMPLNADLTIGIDVKKKLAGFTFVDKFSKNILTKFDKSDNKERLSSGQVVKMLVKNIALLCNHSSSPVEKIVIHRDGRLFTSERDGILMAIKILKEKDIIPQTASVSFVEIPKHSISPFRLFDVTKEYDIKQQRVDNGLVLNPEIGSYVKINPKEAFLCTTGREFSHGGSSNPLYVKYSSGTLSLDNILQDIYFLSCLAYTKPDDCSRYPVTIKITDRRINTLGSPYDEEYLDILKSVNI
ncbi:argonaute/piwi family protein [Pedobacter yonginense]|nr:hypothetical protein [Pedobacter yonginense]